MTSDGNMWRRALGRHNPAALYTEASPGDPFPVGDYVGQSISKLPLEVSVFRRNGIWGWVLLAG